MTSCQSGFVVNEVLDCRVEVVLVVGKRLLELSGGERGKRGGEEVYDVVVDVVVEAE